MSGYSIAGTECKVINAAEKVYGSSIVLLTKFSFLTYGCLTPCSSSSKYLENFLAFSAMDAPTNNVATGCTHAMRSYFIINNNILGRKWVDLLGD